MAGFTRAMLNFGKQSFTYLSNEITEEVEQREMTRPFRDYIAKKSALVDCAQQDEALNKALGRINLNEQQLLERIATFQAAKQAIKP